MRVAMLTNAVAPDKLGGLERYVRELSGALVEAGAEVAVLAKRTDPAQPAAELGEDGVRILRHDVGSKRSIAFAPAYVPRVARATARHLRELSPDVVHTHFVVPALAPILSGRPFVHTFHAPLYRELLVERQGGYPLARPVQRPAVEGLRRTERQVLKRAARTLVLSDFMRREAAAIWPGAAGAALVPGGIDTHWFSPGPGVEDGWAAAAEPLLFTARRLTPRTGVAELLDAMPAVARELPGARLAIAGAGGMEREVRASLERQGLGDRVRLLGRVTDEELRRWYRAADLVVMPTQELEGFGLTTAEALACGTPVVGTPVGATPEVLAGLDPELLSAGRAPDQIAHAVVRLCRAGRLADLAGRARGRALELSWGRVVERHLEEYERLAPSAPSRRPQRVAAPA